MIDYGPFEFAAAKHVGADWFCLAMQCCGFPRFTSRDARPSWPLSSSSPKLRVSLIRHPVAWLQDVFSADPEACCLEDHVLDHLPVPHMAMVLAYPADSFLRFEDLPGAFLELARSVGVNEGLLRHPLFSHVPLSDFPLPLSQEVRARVVEANQEMCERFDYW